MEVLNIVNGNSVQVDKNFDAAIQADLDADFQKTQTNIRVLQKFKCGRPKNLNPN